MFDGEKKILFITKEKITAFKVVFGRAPKSISLFESEWTNETLINVLLQIKKKVSDKFRVLLADDLVYITSFYISSNVPNERQVVLEKAKEHIPEDLKQISWDFKEIQVQQKDPRTTGLKTIQVVAPVSSFMRNFDEAIKKSGIIVDAVEPTSYALSRIVKEEKEPQLIINFQDKTSLVFCHQGLVLAVKTSLIQPNSTQINNFINFNKDRFGIVPAKIILSGKVEEVIIEGYKIERRNLDPFISVALKKDIKGPDEKVLNIDILPLKKSLSKKFYISLILIFVVTLLLILVGLFFVKKSTFRTQEKVVLITKTPTPSPTPILNKQEFTIQILNGSGGSGVAGKMETLLKNDGYEIAGLGNADNFDYLQTEIRVKEKVNNIFFDSLKKTLEIDYKIVKGKPLTQEEKTDIVIIIGKQ